ncbi:MAG: DNA gyrase subunit A [Oscillospiraceae bacterium]|nr:DNA gyrase subunit A [Oscillospiraceae bacterium]
MANENNNGNIDENVDYATNAKQMINVDIEEEMKSSFRDYSMSVITSRALPDVRDGLKPVHRRILYTMYENGLTPDKAYRKCADTVGAVLGSYHPHGDASVYDALVRLAQNFSMRYILVDGQGNFGTVDGDPAAAYRYTEAKMSKIATVMLQDIEKDTVPFVPNYDDRKKEPSVLPARYPNLLVNGSIGIAVGMATNIPPHNLKEVINGVCALIDDPDIDLDGLMEHIKGPDFPTGGIIMGRGGIRAAYGTGRGKIILRGRAELEQSKDRTNIIITELPYMVNKARLIESIAELVKDKRIDGIVDLVDESDREGMRIVVKLRRDVNAEVILNQLYSYTQLQDTVGVIMLALCDGQPKILTLKQMMTEYITFQEKVIVRRTKFDLNKANERAHLLEGYIKALDCIDEVIKILRASKNVPEGKENLIQRFGFSDLQAAAIVAMPLGRLTGLERQKIEDELGELKIKIEEFKEILADEHKVLGIIKKELEEIRDKFQDERRTQIENVSGEVDIEELIPVEDCVITMTHMGYIKRQAADTYKAQRRGGRGITGATAKEEDFVKDLFVCSSHDYILFFTTKGRVFRLKGYEIPESGRSARGAAIINLLQIEQGEKISAMIRVNADDMDGYLSMATKRGVIKRTEVEAFKNVRKGGIIALSLDEGDELAWVKLTKGNDDLILSTRNGVSIRFNENDAREMGRTARGVRAIRLDEDDEVVGLTSISEGSEIMTITEKGIGRRSPISDYRTQSRGGKGVTNYKNIEEKGKVVGAIAVNDDEDIIIITDNGIIIRFAVSDVSVMSRYASGVKVMRIPEGCKVVSFSKAPRESKDEDVESESDEGSENGEEAESASETVENAGDEEV